MSLIVRNYQEKDYEHVINLHVKSKPGHSNYHEEFNDIIYNHGVNGGTLLVGEFYEKIVAVGGFRHLKKNTAVIEHIQVYPGFTSRGFDRQILHTLEIQARVKEYSKLIIRADNIVLSQTQLSKFGYKLKSNLLFWKTNSVLYEKFL